MRDTSRRTLSVVMSLCLVLAIYKGSLIFNNGQKIDISNSDDEINLHDRNNDKKSSRDQFSYTNRKRRVKRYC